MSGPRYGRLTHNELLSYGFKQGDSWGDQRRALERALDYRDHDRVREGSKALMSNAHSQAQQHYDAHAYTRNSGYGAHTHRMGYSSPGRTTYSEDPWTHYRDSSRRSVSSRALPVPPNTAGYARSYSTGYTPSQSYTLTPYQSASHSGSSRYSGHGYSASVSSASYAPRSVYDSDDGYTSAHAPSSIPESEPHFASGYAETTFVVEPSESGESETYYSGEHSSSGDSESEGGGGSTYYSGSEGDSVYSEGADDEYDDYDDDGGSYSNDGGYYYAPNCCA
ncbi:hypothetical protein B0H10DRAFT_2038189 [Mycena sp. CBHHK59/15]|nr:hypothetical protein B0H10DRAFT_2038189 [Mycena sp. CBHHK59/15]